MKERPSIFRKELTHSLLIAIAAMFINSLAVAADPGWPREIESEKATILLYQPQIESFKNNVLTGRAAVSITPAGKTEPIFGAVWMTSRVETDREDRLVFIRDVRVPRVRFPESTPEQEAELAGILEEEIPKWDLTISQDRLLAGLDMAEKEKAAAKNMNTAPPKIIFTTQPSVLVTLDGDPILIGVEGSNLKRVANTPYLIVLDQEGKGYYLYAGKDAWFTTEALTGEWKLTEKPPAKVAKLAPDESEIEVPEAPEGKESGTVPRIVVVTEPAELIYTDGEPEYTLISGKNLMYINNTDSNLFQDRDTEKYYVLLTGRWYESKSLKEGPWEFVPSNKLPESFKDIPADSDVADVRTFVAGTEEASDAVLDAQIPQTAKVDRKKATLEVTYDGDPKFQKIKGTDLEYAVNTSFTVLKEGEKYYACHEGAWFVAWNPKGPWRVATDRPGDVEEIPPEYPVYNVKYVYIYGYTPEVVYVGYLPGYTYTYVYGTTIIYGTGYYYPGWYGTVYYPRPATWGFSVRYNPWTGWSFGLTYSNGWFTFGIGYGGWGHWHGGWWGPAGYHGYWRGYNRGYYRGWHRGYARGAHAGYRAGYRAGQRSGYRRDNIYRTTNRPGVTSPKVDRTRDRARVDSRRSKRPATGKKRDNNVYTDKKGNVYRKTDKGWQQRDKGNWSDAGRGKDRSGYEKNRSNLDRDHNARRRGSQRTNNYQRSRSSGGGRGGGGRRR